MISIALLLAVTASADIAPPNNWREKRAQSRAKESAEANAKAQAATAAAKEKAAKKESKPMEWKGQQGGPHEAGHRLITDQKGWEALWRVMGKDAPALDFAKYNAVVVFLGERPTGGWTATFADAREKEGDTIVSYMVKEPKGFTTQAFTNPYHIRAYAKPAKGKMLVMEAKPE